MVGGYQQLVKQIGGRLKDREVGSLEETRGADKEGVLKQIKNCVGE